MWRDILGKAVGTLSSMKLTVVLLCFLGLLTWLGTLEQVENGLYQTQKVYFESLFVVQRVGFLAIPLPGAYLVLGLLGINLILGGILRMVGTVQRFGMLKVGILIAHFGIAMLLVSSFVKMHFSDYGQMPLYAGQRASHFSDYHLWEIALIQQQDDGDIQELIIPQEDFVDAGNKPIRFTDEELPFELELHHFMPNCQPVRTGPMQQVRVPVVDGFRLQPQPMRLPQEANAAGIYATAVDKQTGDRTTSLLWGLSQFFTPNEKFTTPWTVVSADGSTWGVELRHRQYRLPFALELIEFKKEEHPGIQSPRWYSSDVRVIEGGSGYNAQISMNKPLRKAGYVVYQASFGPPNAPPGAPLYTSLAVSRNPSDQFPLWACVVIAIGLILHFTVKLTRYIQSESMKKAAAGRAS